ncbi:nitrous oxide-stimulated promoter family protein [Vibrio cincinnatiensis]|uniref:nitrous oxide-stimulated promoter family protein n=1 Tax=Vibrio cincinnatiensis TaxID=675 RepID=UPI0012AC7DE1|nr:nitrous oxide-stimulated promoter family protein [Vibrio cincinnatiensis]MCG3736631.1 nitrous oxide-stimulated promoter family protein [Vibrio cincinnatiensis]MCG3747103.1 nitrous oxide-stimulated promoter family protein [Vibrio cincinnatiensis]MCG3760357.1 nitrous oxide-stimulated promoter family protein [Vibrio cincinnatiensis]MCG3763639.1 nitrous oxide-stimulated promoter family protein [Vibrio cincinnatiensis]
MEKILSGKLFTEFKTVQGMVRLYCRQQHGTLIGTCAECQSLIEYAQMRLDRCPYGQNKPTCNQCPIHCYKPEPKEYMRLVMRYAGPRMLLHHPILAIRHLLHERRALPELPSSNQSHRQQRLKANKKKG